MHCYSRNSSSGWGLFDQGENSISEEEIKYQEGFVDGVETIAVLDGNKSKEESKILNQASQTLEGMREEKEESLKQNSKQYLTMSTKIVGGATVLLGSVVAMGFLDGDLDNNKDKKQRLTRGLEYWSKEAEKGRSKKAEVTIFSQTE